MTWKFIGFVVGFALAALVEFGVLYALDLMPRGLGWVVLPFVAGSTLASTAPSLVQRFQHGSAPALRWKSSKSFRAVVTTAGLWLLAVPAYWWLFEPYDFYMGDEDWALMLKVMLFPAIVLAVGYVAYEMLVNAAPMDPVATSSETRASPQDTGHTSILSDSNTDSASEAKALMERYGIVYLEKKKYYQCGELHFDRLAEALAHAQYLERSKGGR